MMQRMLMNAVGDARILRRHVGQLGEVWPATPGQRTSLLVQVAGRGLFPRCVGSVEPGWLARELGSRLIEVLDAPLPGPAAGSTYLVASAAFLVADGLDTSVVGARTRELLDAAAPPRTAHASLAHAFSHALAALFFGDEANSRAQAETAAPNRSGHYGGNLRALAGHLATAAQDGGDFESIRAPVDGCLSMVDTLMETYSIDRYGLVMLGLVAGHTIGGHPLDDTLSWWGRYLQRAVGITDGPVELP